MAYEDFVAEFAAAQGIESPAVLLRDFAEKYSFQIRSRERARDMLATVVHHVGDVQGLRVLDVGCAYGSFAIEFAKAGATVVGVDVNDKWLRLAAANARDEVDVKFLNCDASSHPAANALREHGPFDLVILNDVLEHIYDTAGLLTNVRRLLSPSGRLYFKVPNGLATRHVLSEGHKKVFALSLLPPDYWQLFVKAPFNIYYRRRAYFDALFEQFGFVCEYRNPLRDESRELTVRHVLADVGKIRRQLKRDAFESPLQYRAARAPVLAYVSEAKDDCSSLDWSELYSKYRVTFWEGVLSFA
jgi:SAM-dependent methyltransferase